MKKFSLIVAGIAAGAAGAVLVVLFVALSLYRPPPGSWDFGTPVLILYACLAAGVLGGLMGGVAGWMVADRQGVWRAGKVFGGTMAVVAALTLVAAGDWWLLVHTPQRAPDASDRERWARTRGKLEPSFGRSLAGQLLTCYRQNRGLEASALTAGSCAHEDVYRLGTQKSGYDVSDDGWRWSTVKTGYGTKVVIQPDPLLNQPGPLFEFDADGVLVARASPDAPGYAIAPALRLVEDYRACVLESVRTAAPARWTGDWNTAVDLAGQPGSCPALTAPHHPRSESGWHDVTLSSGSARLEISYRALRQDQGGGFELHVFDTLRRYMLDANGDWHVTTVGSWATRDDVRPEGCEIDPAVACPDEGEKSRRYAANAAYERIATRLRFAMDVNPGERMVLQFDRSIMPGLERVVGREFKQARVEVLEYGVPEDLEKALGNATAYVGLPSSAVRPADGGVLARWVIRGGTRRGIRLQSPDSIVDLAGERVPHTTEPDEAYLSALTIDDPISLIEQMDAIVASLSAGEVRVTTPLGTDISFRVGERPFNRQDGSLTRDRAEKARMLSDRFTSLPAGLLRVAAVESSVHGVLAIPAFRISDHAIARTVRLEFSQGLLVHATAVEGQHMLDAFIAATPSVQRLGEFALGLNAKLAVQPGASVAPGFGCGAGIVRLVLGGNEELAGTVQGEAIRSFLFTDATVMVDGGASLVKDGVLTAR